MGGEKKRREWKGLQMDERMDNEEMMSRTEGGIDFGGQDRMMMHTRE